MELKIKPYHKNDFQIGAILIRGASVSLWIKEIQSMQFSLKEIEAYAIPNTIPNSIWGCMIIPSMKINKDLIGKNELCQNISANFFIPEKSILSPAITASEIEKLFSANKHIMHPEFGLAELKEEINFQKLLLVPTLKSYYVNKPMESIFIPNQIKSFQINPVSEEEVIKNLEENIFPKKSKMKTEPLNILEKAKLSFYKLVFGNGKNVKENGDSSAAENNSLWSKIMNSIFKKERKWMNKLQQDFENLEERNQKEVDKLLKMLKINPEEALKYAIPLDDIGSSRGNNNGQFNLSKRWFDFSLFNSSLSSRSAGTVNLGDHFFELQKQYNNTAEDLIKHHQYQQAAFVYMKLLKNYNKAAETLEEGKYFQEAAAIYLKYEQNKKKAAACYEKGNMIDNAIGIYKELNEHEKVGDLYIGIHKRKEANIYFEKAIESHKFNSQYVKASLIYKNKMNNKQGGQSLLLDGWKSQKDAFNCLNNYFINIPDLAQLKNEIGAIYSTDVSDKNREMFLNVIQYEYQKKNELAEYIKEMAYEIIATQIKTNPSIVAELKSFNVPDKELIKDTIRFKINNKPS